MDDDNGFSTPALLIFAAVLTFIIMAVGIFGNFLTVMALVKSPKVRNVAAAFIINLCLADLLFCLLVLPFSAMRFLQGKWTHINFLCKLVPFIQYGNIGVSLLFIAMITINRYIMIAHHTSYSQIYTRRWICAMIAFCWLFAYGMQIPTLLAVWGKFDYDPKLETCSILPDENGRSSKSYLFVIAFVIPCIIIVACYTKIFWVVHESEMRMKKYSNGRVPSLPNNLRPVLPPTANVPDVDASTQSYEYSNKLPTADVADQKDMRAKQNEWRVTKMVLAIFLSFVVCYLPITIMKVIDDEVNYPNLHVFSYIMLYLSACLNPIIYVIMNKQYRKAYKTVILCEPSKLLSLHKRSWNGNTPEKENDIGMCNNRHTSMVSQISTLDQPPSTISHHHHHHHRPTSS